MTNLIRFLILLFVICACHPKPHADNSVSQGFIDSLEDKQLPEMKYWISLPPNVTLRETRGEDFSIFYLSPADSLSPLDYSGGIYFGNFPSEFPANSDSCRTETIQSALLGKDQSWKVYQCPGDIAFQIIIDNESNDGWDQQIHAFGHASNKRDLYRVLKMYATLRLRTDSIK